MSGTTELEDKKRDQKPSAPVATMAQTVAKTGNSAQTTQAAQSWPTVDANGNYSAGLLKADHDWSLYGLQKNWDGSKYSFGPRTNSAQNRNYEEPDGLHTTNWGQIIQANEPYLRERGYTGRTDFKGDDITEADTRYAQDWFRDNGLVVGQSGPLKDGSRHGNYYTQLFDAKSGYAPIGTGYRTSNDYGAEGRGLATVALAAAGGALAAGSGGAGAAGGGSTGAGAAGAGASQVWNPALIESALGTAGYGASSAGLGGAAAAGGAGMAAAGGSSSAGAAGAGIGGETIASAAGDLIGSGSLVDMGAVTGAAGGSGGGAITGLGGGGVANVGGVSGSAGASSQFQQQQIPSMRGAAKKQPILTDIKTEAPAVDSWGDLLAKYNANKGAMNDGYRIEVNGDKANLIDEDGQVVGQAPNDERLYARLAQMGQGDA